MVPSVRADLSEDRDVRLDPSLIDEPTEHLGRAISAVGGEPFRVKPEALFSALDHGARRADLSLPDRAACLDIDDDRVVEIDQVVGGVGEERVSFEGACPLRRRVRAGDELRSGLAGGTPGRLIKGIEILSDGSARERHRFPVDILRGFSGALLVGIGFDQAGVEGLSGFLCARP